MRVAFSLLQHNMLPSLKALYNSCVNSSLLWNVNITQRPISHTHYNDDIHITLPFFSFLSIHLMWIIFPRNQTKMASVGRGSIQSYLYYSTIIFQQMDSFVWVWVCICLHIRQPPYKTSNKQRNGRKDDQRYWEAPTLWGLLPGQDDSPFHQFSPHQSLWSQSSSCRLRWKQSWPFPALAAVGYGLWKGCDPHPSITLPDFYCFLFLSSDLISIVQAVLFWICVLAYFSDLCMLAAKGSEASCIVCWTVMGSGLHPLPFQQGW